MKSKKIIQILAGVVIAFVAGVMLGITLTNPGMSLSEAAGTIGRVDQYRNVRITEADIELRNEFLSDETLRETYIQYLTFEYSNNIQMADNVRYALEAARTAPDFRATNSATLKQMEDYAIFLDNVRLNILEALSVISDLSDRDRVAIRTVLNTAGNAVSQTITRSNAIFNYLRGVEVFFDEAPQADFPQLVNAHDRLFTNLMAINLINDNRPVLEYLLAKGMMDEDSELAQLNMESLQGIVIGDAEKLKFFNQETLQDVLQNMDQLRSSLLMDGQQLQQMLRSGQNLNAEALQAINSEALQALNMQALQGSLLFDVENLGTGFPID